MSHEVMLVPMSLQERQRYVWPSADEHAAREVRSGRYEPERAAAAAAELTKHHANTLQDADHQHLFAVQRGGAEVGTVWLSTSRKRPVVGVKDLHLIPEHRGRGLGRAALVASENWARARGAAGLVAAPFASDTLGIHLLGSQGLKLHRLYVEADPRQATIPRFTRALRPMPEKDRVAFLERHGRDAVERTDVEELALKSGAGRVLLRVNAGPDGPQAIALHVERADESNLAFARLITGLITSCHARGHVRLTMQLTPHKKERLDATGTAPWRVPMVMMAKPF